MTVVAFLLVLGLCARLTRLAVDDTITKPIRDFFLMNTNTGGEFQTKNIVDIRFGQRQHTTTTEWVENPAKFRHKAAKFMSELLDCPWCTSVHVAFWVLLVGNTVGPLHLTAWAFATVWASIAWLVGVASTIVGVLHGLERVEGQIVDGK